MTNSANPSRGSICGQQIDAGGKVDMDMNYTSTRVNLQYEKLAKLSKAAAWAEVVAWAEALGISAQHFGLGPVYVTPPRHKTYHWYFTMPGECLLSGRTAPRLRALPSEMDANPTLPKVYWGITGISNEVKLWIPQGWGAWIKQRAAELGRVYMANGEKAVYAALSMGLPAFCTATGEGSIKSTTASDVQAAFGDVVCIQLVDNDETGRKAAQTMGLLAQAAGLRWKALDMGSLPGMPPKGDLVEAIGLAGRDVGRLHALLDSARVIPLMAQPQPERPKLARYRYDDDMDFETRKRALIDDLERYISQHADKVSRQGDWLNFRSLFREDKRPSAGFNTDSGVYHDFATGETLSAWALAKALGIDIPIRPTRPTRTARKRPSAPQAHQDGPQAPLSISPEAQAHIRAHAWHEGLAPVAPWAATDSDKIKVAVFDAPYVNQALTYDELMGRVNIIQSPTGSGKTEAVAGIIQQAEAIHQTGPFADTPYRALIITHRVSLSKAAARRLSLLGFEVYDELGGHIKSADKLVITIDSLHKLHDDADGMPRFDMVIVDEIEQVALHVGRKSTLSGRARVEAYACLLSVMKAAHTVIGMDAHAGRLSALLLTAVKQADAQALGLSQAEPIYWWRNAHKPNLGRLVMGQQADALIALGLARATAEARRPGGLPVAMGFDSRRRAEEVHRHAQQAGLNALLVTAHTQDDEAVKAFLANPNAELGRYHVLIFSPSISTGFDIQAACAAVYIVAQGVHLRPNDVLQAARRFRRAAMTYVYIRPTHGAVQTFKGLRATTQAAALLSEQGLPEPEPERPIDTGAIAGLSMLNAACDSLISRDRANDHRAVFWGLAEAEGYSVHFETWPAAPDVRAALKAHREALDAQERAATLALTYALSKDDYRALQLSGKATQDDRRAALRGAIETARYTSLSATIGAPVMTPQDYDLLHTSQARAMLRRQAVSLSPAWAIAQDSHEQGWAWQERHLHRASSAALYDAMALMEAHQASEHAIRADELLTLASTWYSAHKAAVDWADTDAGQAPAALSDAPIAALRRFLKRHGIGLKSKQVQISQARMMTYWVEVSDAQAQMWTWAAERNQWAAIAQAQAQGLPQPVLKSSEAQAAISDVFRAIGQAAQQAAQLGFYRPLQWPSDGAERAA